MKSSIVLITVFSFLLSLVEIPKECILAEDYCVSEEAAIFLAIVTNHTFIYSALWLLILLKMNLIFPSFFLFYVFKLLKFGIIFFIVNLMSYTSEVFPTVLRSQGQGICMIVGSIGKFILINDTIILRIKFT